MDGCSLRTALRSQTGKEGNQCVRLGTGNLRQPFVAYIGYRKLHVPGGEAVRSIKSRLPTWNERVRIQLVRGTGSP
jgi:hypothetical protein